MLPAFASAQAVINDSVANALRVRNLKTQIDALNQKITAEDAKRNKVILGVSPSQLEAMNDRQDSVCLELRSQLTDKELELKELTARQTAETISQQVSNLRQEVLNAPPRRKF